MKVPYALSVYGEDEINAVSEVLREHKSIIGSKTAEFESKVAGLFGKKHGIMVNSGSSANLLAIEMLHPDDNTEVITPALTFSTTVAPLLQKKARPIFVDVKPGTYLVDEKQVNDAIGPKTKALMIPSLIGNIPDYPKLSDMASEHNIVLIEDSCDTIGARIGREPTGKYTDISTTSFYGSHIITAAGGGGMICVNDPNYERRCRLLRGWGRSSAIDESEDIKKRFGSKLDGIPYDSKFIFSEVGYNFLPLEISSAFGLVQVSKLPGFIEIRKRNFSELREFFTNYSKFFILPSQSGNVETAWLAFPLTIKDGAPFSRMELSTFLENKGIQTRPIFAGNILKQPGFKDIAKPDFRKNFPNANSIMERGLLIGCNNGLGEKHIKYMKDSFKTFLDKF